MPPAYEVLLLNTAIPQIQAAQSGDTYVVPRDIAFSTVASLAAGTEALPSLVATGDTNTGFWFPAADTIAASTGGTRRLTIDSSGNLGLGVTPSAWSTFGSVFQGTGYALAGFSSGSNVQSALFCNAFFNGSNYIYRTTATASQYLQISGQHQWHTAPSGTAGNAISFTQAMTLDASGNLGVGITNPTARLHLKGTSGSSPNTNGILFQYSTSTTNFGAIGLDNSTGDLVVASGSGAALRFYTNSDLATTNERARITSGGDFRLGTNSYELASNRRMTVLGTAGIEAVATGTGGEPCVECWQKHTSGDNVFIEFLTETAATSRGSISYNRTAGLVAYNTTSDYRAKDILGPVANPGATIDALKVYEGKMKGATQSRPMLVAHEAQEHAPYAVTGEKDAVNEDGTPKYQQMDVSSLVPLLIAEIQSLRARVAQLEQGA
jgi:hypothetical protein